MDPHHGKHEPRYSEAGDPHDLAPVSTVHYRTRGFTGILLSGFALGMIAAHAGGPPPLGVTVRATVSRIIDGDTIEATVSWPVMLRLKDCWAPELRGPEKDRGEAAKAHMQSLAPIGEQCIISVDSHDAGNLADLMTFGRVVADVWVDGSEVSLSEAMIEAGHAEAEK